MIFTRGSGLLRAQRRRHGVRMTRRCCSQAVGKPVRVQLSRKDEMAWARTTGFAFVIDQQRRSRRRAATSSRGTHEAWSATLGNRPGNNSAGQRGHPGLLAGFAPAAVRATLPMLLTRPTGDNGSNAAPAYVTGCVGGTGRRHRHGRQRARAAAYRAVAVLHRTAPLAGAAAECVRARIILRRDCRAGEGGSRRATGCATSSDPRLKDVITAAAKAGELGDAAVTEAAMHPRPASPAAAASRACSTKATTDTAALVAEVDVNQDTGVVTAKRLVVAQDCRADLESRRRDAISSKAARCRD